MASTAHGAVLIHSFTIHPRETVTENAVKTAEVAEIKGEIRQEICPQITCSLV